MIEKNIDRIKQRANIVHKVITAIFILGILIILAGLIASIFLFFTSPDRYTAVKGNLNWSIRYSVENNSYFSIYIPFKVMQPLDSSMFSAKNAFITYLISALLGISLSLYGIKQILNILKSTTKDITPFIMENAKNLKKLAYTIIIYSLATDLISNILCSAFVIKIFTFELSNIHLSGVLFGGLIFIIAEIFQYGIYLQNEYDTTL